MYNKESMERDIVIGILVEMGLDKRLSDNPEAVRQIGDIVLRDVKEAFGEEAVDNVAFERNVRRVLSRGDFGVRGNRPQNCYSINEDGSLGIKFKTYSDKEGFFPYSIDRRGIYSMDHTGEAFLISETENTLKHINGNDISATCTVSSRAFNRHGLEMSRKSISQSVSGSPKRPVATCGEAFQELATGGDWSLLQETAYMRSKDLVTQTCRKTNYKGGGILLYSVDKIMEDARRQTWIRGNTPINTGVLRDYMQTQGVSDSKTQIVPAHPPEYNGNYLSEQTEHQLDACSRMDAEEIQYNAHKIYEYLPPKNEAFRSTLLEVAKTNKDVQDVVDRLGIQPRGVVTVEDYEKAYDAVDVHALEAAEGIIPSGKEAITPDAI